MRLWPFKRKEAGPDARTEAFEALRNFRDVGEKFNYLGVEMIVESHWKNYPAAAGFVPMLCAAYRNDHGEINHAYFLCRELPALRAENPTEKPA